MADDADRTADRMEIEEQLRLRVRKPELPFTGACHYCEEPVEAPLKYCSPECREDHELELKMKGRNGRGHV